MTDAESEIAGEDDGTDGARTGGEEAEDGTKEPEETVRVWLVERTYSDDEQNLIILVYATPDGDRYLRKERALTSFSDVRDTTAAIDADPGNLGAVREEETREQYAAAAQSMQADHAPDDVV